MNLMLFQLLLLLLLATGAVAPGPYLYDELPVDPGRPTMVHLFEWKWTDVAKECEDFLQHYGYGAVQVSPPNEHIMLYKNNDVPWYVRYQPVSYRLSSRSGSDAEFRDMVQRCNKVGVRIIVDAVTNHMVGVGQASGQPGVGSSGSASFNGQDGVESFPAVPYGSGDFHDRVCHGDIQDSDYHNNAERVRTCRLVGLLDLNHASPYVRLVITNFLNELIDIGVAGFRLDASKHMNPADLGSTLGGLKNLRSDVFGPGKKPFVVHEVIDHGGEAISAAEYINVGRYTNFNFGTAVRNAIKRYTNAGGLAHLGPGFGYGNLADHDVLSFIENHDNQRDNPESALTYKDGDEYRLAVSFMLAWPYGVPRVMSGYGFSSHDQGPPNEGANTGYRTRSPTFNPDHTCHAEGGWMCEHRWPTIRQMALFRGVSEHFHGHSIAVIVTEDHRVAFAREGAGFFVLNNNNGEWQRDFVTTLPAGTYCDQYNGALENGHCTGASFNVDTNGHTTIRVAARNAVALSLASRVGGVPPPPSPPKGDWQRTAILLHKATPYGQNIFLKGGNFRGAACARAPYQQAQDACAVPIRHRTKTHFAFAEYRAWSQRDDFLDPEGAEYEQGLFFGTEARGTPAAFTTNDRDAFEFNPLNTFGSDYWLADLDMDCSRTKDGWFEIRGVYETATEPDVSQSSSCSGSFGARTPFRALSHVARCGALNVFEWGSGSCRIDRLG